MELLFLLIAIVAIVCFVMYLYFLGFRVYESGQRWLRGEHKVGFQDEPLIRKYKEKGKNGIMPISGYFIDARKNKIPAFLPRKTTHSLVMGRSGSGKSTLVEALAVAYLSLPGHNCVCIEPHASLSNKLAKWGAHYGKRVVYIDLALTDGMVVSWNPLSTQDGMDAETVASFLLGCFDDRFKVFSTPQQAEALKAGFTILAENNLTLDRFADVFYDDDFRGKLLEKTESSHCLNYFRRYENLTPSQKETKIQPAINKASLLLQDSCRLVLCQQSEHSLSLSEVVNDPNSILLICLNRGASPTVADLLGSLFLSALKNVVFSRKPDNTSFPMTHIFCDEFPAYLSPDVGSVLLAESRKYKIDVALISQFLQVSDPRFKRELIQNTTLQFLFNLELEEARLFDNKLFPNEKDKSLSKLPPFFCHVLDKNAQADCLFQTEVLDCPDITPVYSCARPVDKVLAELKNRKKKPTVEQSQKEKDHEEELKKFQSRYKKKGKK